MIGDTLNMQPAKMRILAYSNVSNQFTVEVIDFATGAPVDLSDVTSTVMNIRRRAESATPILTIAGTRVDNLLTFDVNTELFGIFYYEILIVTNDGVEAIVADVIQINQSIAP